MTHVVVVGDALLDVDVDTTVERLVPDSAAPVLDEVHRVNRPGGAALAARLCADDPAVTVTLVAAIPDDAAGAALRVALGPKVRLVGLPCRGATGVKTRLRRGDQVLARLDQGGSGVEIAAAPAAALDAIAAADAVLVSDYGRGVTSAPNLADALTGAAGSRPVAWDPHPRGGPPVPGARVVTPNAAEAAHFCGAPRAVSLAEACRQARDLVTAWAAGGVALTLGGRGAVLASGADTAAVFPVPNSVSADACGAGDRFAGAVACALASGALTSEAVACAVHAATTFLAGGGVAALGAAPASRSGGLVRELVTSVHARRGTVVATGGCFDLLHAGHVATLNAARALGDCLIVCINSDASVRRRKGPDRPLQSVADRRRVLEGLRAVDAVLVFDEDTPRQVLPMIRPDIWVKGGDYAGAELPETGLVRSWGGEVVTVPYLPGHSTSQLLTRVRA